MVEELSFLWLSIKLNGFSGRDEAVGAQLISLLAKEEEEEEESLGSDVKSPDVSQSRPFQVVIHGFHLYSSCLPLQ